MLNLPAHRPLVAVVAGSGQVARAAVNAGADLLLVLNAGRYRSLGSGSLACFLPYANANDQTLELLRDVLPVAGSIPVIAGLLGVDPTRPLADRLEEFKRLGVKGVTNWPALGFVDGQFREALEAEGFTLESELQALAAARSRGLAPVGFVHRELDVAQFASVSDGLILNIGLTHEVDVRQDRSDQLQLAITRLGGMRETARRSNPEAFTLMFGGAVTTAEDFEMVLNRCDIDGFAGGSVFERLPVSRAIESTIRQFKSVLPRSDMGASAPQEGPLIGRSASMQALRRSIKRIAAFDVNVCIEGDTGTGKELVATELHRHSPRREAPLVTLNCGAIPDTLLESELFGYEKGAFTGAERRRLGKFELASGGTLFLDEVADLSPRAQVALLRAIQQGEITRVGGDAPIHVDVRIVTATHQNLERLVAEGRFRADLFYRLNQMSLHVPRLAERSEDIPLLIRFILTRLEARLGRRLAGVSSTFEDRLRSHSWPGNVRELEHALCRAAILEDGSTLAGASFAPRVSAAIDSQPYPSPTKHHEPQSLRLAAEQALHKSNGNKARAASLLGISRKTLYSWLRSAALPSEEA